MSCFCHWVIMASDEVGIVLEILTLWVYYHHCNKTVGQSMDVLVILVAVTEQILSLSEMYVYAHT